MGLGKIISDKLRRNASNHSQTSSSARRTCRSALDIYFTDNFHAKAREWGLSEDHARHVFYEGDVVKENMKVAAYKGQEIGTYIFRARETNQPVATSIWKRQFRGTIEKSRR